MISLNTEDKFIGFSSPEEKIKKLKEWGLLGSKATTVKPLLYKGAYTDKETFCEVVGYIPKDIVLGDYETAVININGETHKICPAYLKQMQSKNFNPLSSAE